MRFQDLLMYLAISFMQQLSFFHNVNHVENDWSLSQIAPFICQLVADSLSMHLFHIIASAQRLVLLRTVVLLIQIGNA